MSEHGKEKKRRQEGMTHLETELQFLKSDTLEMWNLVIQQLTRTRTAIFNFDRELLNEIQANEKRVDAFELKIDMDCEHILALFNPLANDLRFVLAVLKINYNLERIGDFAWGIAKTLREIPAPFDPESLKKSEMEVLFDVGIEMLTTALHAFEDEDHLLAGQVFQKDNILDEVNGKAFAIVSDLIRKDPEYMFTHLHHLTNIRKLERVGDHTKNISEEIIFYLDARILRHKKLKK